MKASALAIFESFIEDVASVLGFPLSEAMDLRESSTPSEWLLKDCVTLHPMSLNEILILVEQLSSWSLGHFVGSLFMNFEKVDEVLNLLEEHRTF